MPASGIQRRAQEEEWGPEVIDKWRAKRFDSLPAAKRHAQIFILDQGQSWGPSHDTSGTRMALRCKRKDICDFNLRVARKKGQFGINQYQPHTCPPSTHDRFRTANCAWYIEHKPQRDIELNRGITVSQAQERLLIYHGMPSVPYHQAYWAIELGKEKRDGKEAESYKLMQAYIERMKKEDKKTYAAINIDQRSRRFHAIFVVLGSLVQAYGYIRPFLGFDGTHIKSVYNLTLLLAVGIDADGNASVL